MFRIATLIVALVATTACGFPLPSDWPMDAPLPGSDVGLEIVLTPTDPTERIAVECEYDSHDRGNNVACRETVARWGESYFIMDPSFPSDGRGELGATSFWAGAQDDLFKDEGEVTVEVYHNGDPMDWNIIESRGVLTFR